MTSNSSLGSFRSEEKSNYSTVHTKKMRIKNIVVNPIEFYQNKLLNRTVSTCNYDNSNFDNDISPIIMKLSKILDKIELKNTKFKYFRIWKKDEKQEI